MKKSIHPIWLTSGIVNISRVSTHAIPIQKKNLIFEIIIFKFFLKFTSLNWIQLQLKWIQISIPKRCHCYHFLTLIAHCFGLWQIWQLLRSAKHKPQLKWSATRWHSLQLRLSPRTNLRTLRFLNLHNQRPIFQLTMNVSWPRVHPVSVGAHATKPLTTHQFLSTSLRTLISWNVHAKCLCLRRVYLKQVDFDLLKLVPIKSYPRMSVLIFVFWVSKLRLAE